MSNLKVGSKGVAVSNLQKNLVALHLKISVDGEFGAETKAAVEDFQASHGLTIDGQVGPATQAALSKALIGQVFPTPVNGSSPWMEWMRKHIGEPFVTGEKPTEFDEEVFAHTNYGPLDGVMEPGCAATVCAALEETGFKSTDGADAKSYLHYGEDCDLRPGCIVVFKWASGERHVTFCDHIVNDASVACLGGNQSHSLNVSIFSRKFIEKTCWPVS